MTQKEKFEEAKRLYETANADQRYVLESLFPELKESEDEKIRKALVKQFSDYKRRGENHGFGYSNDKILAWLEKQVEQKPTDKVEPKFKIGNWYQCTKDFFGKGVTFDKNTAYYCAKEGCLQDEYGCHIAIVKDLYDNFKLWTIQDAKDGDVLCSGQIILLFKKWEEDSDWNFVIAYAGIDISGKLQITNGNWLISNSTQPATKEQCDLLFQKMKEAGYEWDDEKKELKVEPKFHEGDIIIHKELGGDYIHNPHKIIQVDILDKKYRLEGGLVAHFGEQDDYELVEQKTVWSKEDEKML